MKILFFEYSTCISQSKLISEGFEMLKSILSDMKYEKEYKLFYLINPTLSNKLTNYPNSIILNEPLEDWLNDNLDNFDYCMFIAPEDNFTQHKLTKIIENKNVKLLNSTSNASFICSSKSNTLKYVPSTITNVTSIIVDLKTDTMKQIKNKINFEDIIIKPDNYTGSNLIYHTNKNELMQIFNIYKENNIKKCIIQEYIPGIPISVSLVVNKKHASILSINTQEIIENKNNIKYNGCKIPFKHELEETIKNTSLDIVKNIEGLYGFIGIDYIILKNKLYFIELNSRITTPYVVLTKINEHNLTKELFEFLIFEKDNFNTKINKEGKFLIGD